MLSVAKMNITANGRKTVGQVQEEFNLKYPYLKIDFYLGSPDGQIKTPLLPEVGLNSYKPSISKTTKIVVKPEHTIEQLKDKFFKTFGINILILTQSGDNWIEASKSDYWSIEYQNEHAERLNLKISRFED